MDIAVNKIDKYLYPSGAYFLVKFLLIPATEMLTDNKGIDIVIKDFRECFFYHAGTQHLWG